MGRPLSFAVTVAANGSAIIGHGYTELIGAKPGSRLTVTHQGDALILTPAGASVPQLALVEGAPTTYDSGMQMVG